MSRGTTGTRRAAGAAAWAGAVILALAGRAEAQLGPGYIAPGSDLGPNYFGMGSNLGPNYFGMGSNLGPNYFGGSPFANPNSTATPYGPLLPGSNPVAERRMAAAAVLMTMPAPPQHKVYYNTSSALPSQAHYYRRRQPPAPSPLGRDEVFKGDGTVRWPAATPKGPELDAKRKAADEAVAAVVREHAANDRATVALSVAAVQKAGAFGADALEALRASKPDAVPDFEHFLQSLDHNILLLADPPTPPAADAR